MPILVKRFFIQWEKIYFIVWQLHMHQGLGICANWHMLISKACHFKVLGKLCTTSEFITMPCKYDVSCHIKLKMECMRI